MIKCTQKNYDHQRLDLGLPRFPPLRALVAAFTDALWARASGVSAGRPLLPPPTCGVNTALGLRTWGALSFHLNAQSLPL